MKLTLIETGNAIYEDRSVSSHRKAKHETTAANLGPRNTLADVPSDTFSAQVWLAPSLLAPRSRLPTNTTARFSATDALARAYVLPNLSFYIATLLTISRTSTCCLRDDYARPIETDQSTAK